MTTSFRIFLASVLAISAISVVPAAHADDDCILPVCDIPGQLADFKTMTDVKRESILEQLAGDYGTNTDPATAQNIIDFTTQAETVAKTDSQDKVVAEAVLVLNQSYEQLAINSPLSANVLVPSFNALTNETNRYHVLTAWGAKVDALTDVGQVEQLRSFFDLAQTVTTAAKDDAYVIREAARWDVECNQRVIALNPAAPQLTLPIADMTKATSDFQNMALAERFLLLKSLTDRFATSTDSKSLTSLVDYCRHIAPILAAADASQAAVVAQNTTLLNQSMESLARSPELDAATLVSWYNQITSGTTGRFAVLTFFALQIPKANDATTLQRLIAFFQGALAAGQASKEQDYVLREAQTDIDNAEQRLVGMIQAPAFPVPVPNQTTAQANFTAMDLASRTLLIQSLFNNYVNGGDTPSLQSILVFARAIRPTLVSAGDDQAAILKQNDALIERTLEQLNQAPDLSADDLGTYFGQLTTPQTREVMITYWGGQVDTATTKAALTRLVRYFVLARKVMNAATDDESWVIRDAMKFEQAARAKLATATS
jgi:hypothetical protein